MLKLDGFDDCVFGVAERNGETFIVYDRAAIIVKLQKSNLTLEDEIARLEEAVEYYDYNILGSYLEGGPGYITEMTLEEINEEYTE
jgi:hypothetical protein